MMLRHFADDDGRLWFWRRDFPEGEARNTSTANLFVEKDLYTYVRGDGSKDTALEEFFAQMEGDGAVFINSLAWIVRAGEVPVLTDTAWDFWRSEEHTSELQSLMRISYAVFCLKKNKKTPP